MVCFLGSLWQYAEFATVHRRLPVHSWSKLCKSSMPEVVLELLCTADACECSATKATSKTKHLNASLEIFSPGSFQKSEVLGSYYGSLVYHDLSSSEYRRKMC